MDLKSLRVRDQLITSINRRWGVLDWDSFYPWWKRPAHVRILMYADDVVRFDGGPFLGLEYVTSLLKSRSYPYVHFDIASAHRDGTDPTASIPGAKKLTDLDIVNNYDEIWFFGFSSTPSLSAPEVAALEAFMAAPKFGGVLATGDHADFGRGIAGQIPRAGAMRQYPAPPASFPVWNTTLMEGPDTNASFDFDDQSDDKPQTIRWKRYRLSPLFAFERRYRPHPVLCGPEGPIDVLPDHQHEGEALAPVPAPADPTWPTKGGRQEAPEVIAWGRITDPAATKHGQEIGVISAYDGHNVDVGRILADSTWHHWFDINLTGVAAPPSPYAGFDETPAGQAALKKIDAYFLNAGVWLAPPALQRAMSRWGWWSVVWTDPFVELALDTPIWQLGEQALSVLGKRAPRCTVSRWVLDEYVFKPKIPWWEWRMLVEKLKIVDVPLETAVAGGIVRQLMQDLGPGGQRRPMPDRAPEDAVLDRSLQAGAEAGMKALGQQLREDLGAIKLLEERKLF